MQGGGGSGREGCSVRKDCIGREEYRGRDGSWM